MPRSAAHGSFTLLAAAGLAVGLASAPAHAQYALGDGRVLDNNLRVGGDGTNDRRVSPLREAALRNAIVTGNVSGGQQFRGEVGYTGTFDFRGETGSGEFFANYADSYYSGFATRGVRGLNDLRSNFAFTAPTGAIAGSQIQIRRPGSGAVAAETAGGGTAGSALGADIFGVVNGTLRSTSGFALRAADNADILARRRTDDGLLVVTAASPLTGVRDVREGSVLLGDTGDRTGVDRFSSLGLAAAPGIDAETAGPGLSPVIAPRREVSERDIEDEFDGSISAENRLTPDRPAGVEDRDEQPDPRLAERIEDNRITSGTVGHREVLRRLREDAEGSGLIDPEEETGDAAIDEFLRGVTEMLQQAPQQQGGRDGQAGQGADSTSGVPGLREEDQAGRSDPASEGDGIALDPNDPEDRAELVRLLRRGNVTMHGLSPDEGEADPVFIRHMTRGERWLSEGRWFDAEERFTAALSIDPASASAAIGRINAQIGAGFYASAALSLRRMLRDYPELTAVIYDEELRPSGERLEEVREQLLERMERDEIVARDAAMLYAFLGYQTGDDGHVGTGFERVAEVEEALGLEPDPLHDLMREVWSDR
jgi:hypothetical protein